MMHARTCFVVLALLFAPANLLGQETVDWVFDSLERIGGVMVYDVTEPTSPQFAEYINQRNFAAAANSPLSRDQGPEGLVVVESHANGSPLLLVANEVSGTLRVFRIDQVK